LTEHLKVNYYNKSGSVVTKKLKTDMNELIKESNDRLSESIPAYNKRRYYEDGTFFTGDYLFICGYGYGLFVVDNKFNIKLWELNDEKNLVLIGSQSNQGK